MQSGHIQEIYEGTFIQAPSPILPERVQMHVMSKEKNG